LTISKLTKIIWQNVVFYKRISLSLIGAVTVIILDIYFGRIISCIFLAVIIWIIANMYPEKMKGKNFDGND
jgi:hypothetical protein